MKRMGTSVLLFLVISAPLVAQDRAWTKVLKDKDKRDALHDRSQAVRGDSGKWNDKPRMQHAPPIAQKPAKLSLDDWADQLLKKSADTTAKDDNWLIFRTQQIDDNDRTWVERIERRGMQITIVAIQSKWQGKYFRNFTYYQVLGLNLGKLEPGKYDVKWITQPREHAKFNGDGRPRNNWPMDQIPTDKKPTELSVTFTVGTGS